MESISVPSTDIIGWIMQFFKANGLSRAIEALEEESSVRYTFVSNKTKLSQQCLDGKWQQVLNEVTDLSLPQDVLFLLYEQVVLELIEKRDVALAQDFLKGAPALLSLKLHREQRYMKLEYLCRLSNVTAKELYEPCDSREDRRLQVSHALSGAVSTMAPDMLLNLLHDGIKYRAGMQKQGHEFIVGRGMGLLHDSDAKVGGQDGDKVVQRAVREHLPQLTFKQSNYPETACFSPDGTSLVLASHDGFIEIYDPTTCALRTDLNFQALDSLMVHKLDVAIGALCVSPDNMLLASGGHDGRIKIWDMTEGVSIKKMKGHASPIACLAFARDGGSCLSGCQDGSLCIHGLTSGQKLVEFRKYTHPITTAIYIGKKYVVSGSAEGTLCSWDIKTGGHVSEISLTDPSARPHGIVCLSALRQQGGSAILVVGRLIIVEVACDAEGVLSIRRRRDLGLGGAEAVSASVSPCESWVYVATTNSEVVVLERSSGETMNTIQISGSPRLTYVDHHPGSAIATVLGQNFLSLLVP